MTKTMFILQFITNVVIHLTVGAIIGGTAFVLWECASYVWEVLG